MAAYMQQASIWVHPYETFTDGDLRKVPYRYLGSGNYAGYVFNWRSAYTGRCCHEGK